MSSRLVKLSFIVFVLVCCAADSSIASARMICLNQLFLACCFIPYLPALPQGYPDCRPPMDSGSATLRAVVRRCHQEAGGYLF
jgi:hypothetical protein